MGPPEVSMLSTINRQSSNPFLSGLAQIGFSGGSSDQLDDNDLPYDLWDGGGNLVSLGKNIIEMTNPGGPGGVDRFGLGGNLYGSSLQERLEPTADEFGSASPWYNSDPLGKIEAAKAGVEQGFNRGGIGWEGEIIPPYHQGVVHHTGEQAANAALSRNSGKPDAISDTAAKQKIMVLPTGYQSNTPHWWHFALNAPRDQYKLYNQIGGSGEYGGSVGGPPRFGGK